MTFARNNAAIARSGIVVVDTVADLRAHPFANSSELVFETLGALTVGDGGGGTWYWDAANTETDNLGTVVFPTGHTGNGRMLRKHHPQEVSPLWWGALPTPADATVAFQAALDYLGGNPRYGFGEGGVCRVPGGVWLVNLTVPAYVEIQGIGRRGYSTGSSDLVTSLTPFIAANPVLTIDTYYVTVKNIDITGVNRQGNGILLKRTGGGLKVEGSKIDMCLNNIASEDQAGSMTLEDCAVQRAGSIGVQLTRDSTVLNCGFTGNLRAIDTYNGQLRIRNNFFEFNDEGIRLLGNANEVQIENNTFDRNRLHDINLIQSSNKYPSYVFIHGNIFKGAGWLMPSITRAVDSTSIESTITTENIKTCKISNNVFQRRFSSPSPQLGWYSPMRAISTNILADILSENSFYGANVPIIRDGADFIASGNEWYKKSSTANDSPFFQKPTYLEADGVILTEGTVGSLTEGHWGWGTPAGFNAPTFYVRLAGDANPTTITQFKLHYDFWQDAVPQGKASSVSYYLSGLNNGEVKTVTIDTPLLMCVNNNYNLLAKVTFYGRIGTTRFGSVLNFALRRDSSGSSIGVVRGEVTPLVGDRVGWDGDGKNLSVNISAGVLGYMLNFTLTGAASFNQIQAKIECVR